MFTHIDALHRKITAGGAPYQANRAVAVLSKMFNMVIKLGWRTDNPAKGIERNHEDRRERFLSADELTRLGEALDNHPDRQAAAIIALLLLTGARKGEMLAMRWQDLDLDTGTWTKPSAHTKQARIHRVPLSGARLADEAPRRDRRGRRACFSRPPQRSSHGDREALATNLQGGAHQGAAHS